MRVSNDQEGAIAALEEGTKPGRPFVFKQADMMVVYELGWTLVGERKYQEAADVFLKMKDVNQWSVVSFTVVLQKSDELYRSHATYHFLAAGMFSFFRITTSNVTYRNIGCYISIGKLDEGQKLLDDIPSLESRRIAGKLQPTEVFLKKKRMFVYFLILLCGLTRR